MRTTDYTLGTTLTGKLAVPSRLSGVAGVFKMVWRQLQNRQAIGDLNDLDDHQLFDIGLQREEVREALSTSFFDDPGRHLTVASRNRTNSFYRKLRRD